VAVRPFLDDLAFPSVAIASHGGCSDPHGMSEPVRQRIASAGSGKIGLVVLGQYGWEPNGVSAYFRRFWNSFVIPAGSCGYGPASNFSAPSENLYWDAGPGLILDGPSGRWDVPQDVDNFNTDLGSHYERGFDAGDLMPGMYSISNGAGGPGVGSFRIDFPVISPSLQWTNQSSLDTLHRDQDLTVSWTPGPPDDGYVIVSGGFLTFIRDPNGFGLGGFACLVRADKGTFTVPGWMIWNDRVASAEVLDVGLQHYRQQEFAAPGLDYGQFLRAGKVEIHRSKITRR
jgi:hypothetical protein